MTSATRPWQRETLQICQRPTIASDGGNGLKRRATLVIETSLGEDSFALTGPGVLTAGLDPVNDHDDCLEEIETARVQMELFGTGAPCVALVRP